MVAQKGKDLLLKVDSDGLGSFETVAGLRTRSPANMPATPAVTALVSLNGTMDYVEVLGYSNDASTPKFNMNAAQTFFQAVRLF